MVRFIINYDRITWSNSKLIYIPIWLDLLSEQRSFTISDTLIYIPIWLDLLLKIKENELLKIKDLHSNMVRFIIQFDWTGIGSLATFTFQYG